MVHVIELCFLKFVFRKNLARLLGPYIESPAGQDFETGGGNRFQPS